MTLISSRVVYPYPLPTMFYNERITMFWTVYKIDTIHVVIKKTTVGLHCYFFFFVSKRVVFVQTKVFDLAFKPDHRYLS